MDLLFSLPKHQYPVSLKSLTSCQRFNIKGYLVDSNNKSYGIFPFFSPLHLELFLGSRIIDNFSDHFSFNLATKNKNDEIHFQQLDNIVLESFSSPSTAIVVMDTSIKNNIATSILHVHIANHPVIKMLHHAAFVTTTEAKPCTKENISKIIVVTDSIYVAKKIFNTLSHPYQCHAVAILSKFCYFFTNNQNNLIEFWECSS